MTGIELVGRWKASGLAVIPAMVLFASAVAHGASLTASWVDNSLGVARTRIERRLGSDPTFQVIADLNPGVTVYVDSAVAAGQTYCYRALAHDGDSVSPYSAEACAVPGDGFNVSVSKAGSGTGTVTSAPAGISCGSVCSAGFPASGAVVLSATPAPGSTFIGWSGGGCSGTQPCAVAGNGAIAATASFAPVQRTQATTASTSTQFSGRCPLPGGAEVGVPYSRPCAVSGGRAPYSCVLIGGALPQGLSLDRDCRIGGTPVRAGATTFTVRISDASGKVVDYTDSASVLPAVSITTTALPNAVVGRAFSATLAPAGGRAPYGWAVVDGTLPTGIVLDPARGIIAGLPTVVGTSGFTIRVRDARGGTIDRALRLVVNNGPLAARCHPTPAVVDAPYTGACAIRGGLAPYSCEVVAGTGIPPAGLAVNRDCTITGTPSVSGAKSFTTRVRDSGGSTVSVASYIGVQPHLGITTAVLPYAIAKRSLLFTLAVAGGTPPYSWSVVDGILPDGLALNLARGEISGVPSDDGVTAFTIRVRDALGAIADRSYRLVVSDTP